MRVVHLTPFGIGGALTRDECRAALALVGEEIRTRLSEYRSRHLFARRPSQLAVLGERFVARRRTLLVISDGGSRPPRILVAATVRASTPHWGRAATACNSVTRRCTRRTVMAIAMIVVLALRHGHTNLLPLVACAAGVAVATSPIFTSLRVRCSDRVLAFRAATLLPELGEELQGVTVLHDFGLPRMLGAPEPTLADVATIGAALSCGAIPTCIAQPCCLDAGEMFATWASAALVPQHVRPERSVLVFPQALAKEQEPTATTAKIIPIDSRQSPLARKNRARTASRVRWRPLRRSRSSAEERDRATRLSAPKACNSARRDKQSVGFATDSTSHRSGHGLELDRSSYCPELPLVALARFDSTTRLFASADTTCDSGACGGSKATSVAPIPTHPAPLTQLSGPTTAIGAPFAVGGTPSAVHVSPPSVVCSMTGFL